MVHLLNLLAAVALLVWGTQIVRTGILRVFGGTAPRACGGHDVARAVAAGRRGGDEPDPEQHGHLPDVTSFLGRALVTLSALAVMLGAVSALRSWRSCSRSICRGCRRC
jgi:phosphate:Na+ symporter